MSSNVSPLRSLRQEMIDLIVEAQRETYSSKLEPFEAYAERLKAQCNQAYDEYIASLQRGYQAIVMSIAADMEQRSE